MKKIKQIEDLKTRRRERCDLCVLFCLEPEYGPGCLVTQYVAFADFEFLISLPFSPKCWLYGGTPSQPL